MASSGSVTFTVNRDEIITAALRRVRKDGGLGENPTAKEITDCAQILNMLVHQWQGDQDSGTGVRTWSRKPGYLFLQKDQSSYILGANSPDHATSAFVASALNVATSANQTVLSLNSIAGMNLNDHIGVQLNAGSIQWSIIEGFILPNRLSIADPLADSASLGNVVYVYTAPMRRPLKILTQKLVDQNGDDSAVDQIPLEQYQALPGRMEAGTVQQIYYEQHVSNGILYTNVPPDDVTRYLSMVFLSPIEDFNAATDTPDYPQEWLLALVAGVTYWIWPEFRAGERPQWVVNDYLEAKATASNAVPEDDPGNFFQARS